MIAGEYGVGLTGVVEIVPTKGPRLHVKLEGHTATMVIKTDRLEPVKELAI